MRLTERTPRREVYVQVKKDAPRRIEGTLMIMGRSRRWLANECGHRSHSFINRVINREVNTVSAETAMHISAALGIPLDDLFLPKTSTFSGMSRQNGRDAA